MQYPTYLDAQTLAQHVDTAPATLQHDDYTFGVVRSPADLDLPLLRSYDAVIVHAQGQGFADFAVRDIRAHVDLDVYLKPVFVYGTPPSEVTETLVDGTLASLRYLERAAERTARILEAVDRFQATHSVSFEDTVLTKLLRFLVSRDRDELAPVAARASRLGYAYPILDVNYPYTHEHRSHGLLSTAEEEQLLVGEFVDAWYVCSTCHESHIHLREVCSSCGVSQVQEEELIHHFRCAYVGPASDFTNELHLNELVCPKCERSLHHIGVDYDKPSSVFTCVNGHTSQSPQVKARCFGCHTDTPAEQLTKQVFKRYRLTARGREQAQSGVMANVQRLSDIHGTVRPDVFDTMLGYEVERVRATGAGSTLALLHFANAGTLFSFISRDERARLLSEFVASVRRHLRPADVSALQSFSSLAILMPALDPATARQRLEAAAVDVRAAIADRYEGYEAQVVPVVEPLATDRPHTAQLEALATAANPHD